MLEVESLEYEHADRSVGSKSFETIGLGRGVHQGRLH